MQQLAGCADNHLEKNSVTLEEFNCLPFLLHMLSVYQSKHICVAYYVQVGYLVA